MTVQEQHIPLPAKIIRYEKLDGVGTLVLADGEEINFGKTACKDFAPAVGLSVFVSALRPSRRIRRASKIRLVPTTEAEIRAQVQAKEEEAKAEQRLSAQQRALLPITTFEAIVRRVKDAVIAKADDDADEGLLATLIEDLKTVGASVSHVAPILQGIAESPTMAHFGSPGPLVEYLETFRSVGYADLLLAAAAKTLTSHFLTMFAREMSTAPLEHYALKTPSEALREKAQWFLEEPVANLALGVHPERQPGPMLEDEEFWSVVELIVHSHRNDDFRRLKPAVEALSAMPTFKIRKFAETLAYKLYLLDTEEHARHIGEWSLDENGCISGDLFLYARCATLAAGRETYEAALVAPQCMLKDTEFEALISLVPEAYHKRTGMHFDVSRMPQQ